MNAITARATEPSTWAGLGLLFQGIAQLLASKGTDATAWASVAAGAVAVIKREGTGR